MRGVRVRCHFCFVLIREYNVSKFSQLLDHVNTELFPTCLSTWGFKWHTYANAYNSNIFMYLRRWFLNRGVGVGRRGWAVRCKYTLYSPPPPLKIENLLGPMSCHLGPKKVEIFMAHPFQLPSKWICPRIPIVKYLRRCSKNSCT